MVVCGVWVKLLFRMEEMTRNNPVKIFDKGIKNIVAGYNHTLVHKEDGSVWGKQN